MTVIAVFLTGCAARASTPETADPAVAAAAIEGSVPERPLRVIFAWRAQEREARFDGRGAARIEPPYRARLDLFGPRGDGVLSAALVDLEIRMPPATEAVRLPPPALMWAVLGVVRPPAGSRLAGTRSDGGRAELHYEAEGARLVYRLRDGVLRDATWEGGSRRMTVELSGRTNGVPREAIFRDWSGYTELVLNVEQADVVEPFPPDIWTPGR